MDKRKLNKWTFKFKLREKFLLGWAEFSWSEAQPALLPPPCCAADDACRANWDPVSRTCNAYTSMAFRLYADACVSAGKWNRLVRETTTGSVNAFTYYQAGFACRLFAADIANEGFDFVVHCLHVLWQRFAVHKFTLTNLTGFLGIVFGFLNGSGLCGSSFRCGCLILLLLQLQLLLFLGTSTQQFTS